jgi:UDP-glucose 4-epimerase
MNAVVHLAAQAHIARDIPESEYDAINRQAVARLAKAANDKGVKLVFASSIGAQSGSSTDRVLMENDEATPTTAYGRSKLQAEQEIKEVAGDFVILRPTLVYGPGVIGNMQRLVRLALSRVPPPFKLIRNRRSLLAVENMCDAIYFVINSQQANRKIFLLADRDPISTRDMISQLRLGAGLSSTQVPVPPRLLRATLELLGRGDIWDKVGGNLVVSTDPLQSLGFEWRIEIRDGLYALGQSSRRLSAHRPL